MAEAPKVHAATFLDSRTACGLALDWLPLGESGGKQAFRNGKPIAVSRLVMKVNCNSCWRACL